MCGSNASSAGISGRVSPNRFDAALSTTTAIGYFARFCWCTMLLSIVISTSNPPSTTFLNNSPFRFRPSRSAALSPRDVRPNRAAIASRDFRPEEDASRARRGRALALLPGERSPAHVLRWGIPRGIPQLNRQPPNDRKDSLLERGSQ